MCIPKLHPRVGDYLGLALQMSKAAGSACQRGSVPLLTQAGHGKEGEKREILTLGVEGVKLSIRTKPHQFQENSLLAQA